MTRTYTTYWSEKDVAPLFAEIDKLKADYDRRLPYIDGAASDAMFVRLTALRCVAVTLTERAD